MTSSAPMATPPACTGRVVITGGAGFVGRAAVAAFAGRGNPVTVVDRGAHPDPAVRSVVGELTDPRVIADAMADGDVAGVVHLAAITSVLRSVEHPAATYQANVAVTQDLLEGCRQAGVGRFIMASTNAVVGDVGHATIDETVPPRPLTPYGATKAAGEMLLCGYAGAYGMATCALRFTNIYGPGMGRKDSFVARMMRAALAGRGVQVYGDGLQRRDLVHVDDAVAAVLAAWDRRFTGTAVIGSGRSVTVLELLDAARTVTGCALPAEHVAAKPGEMPAVVVDISRAREQLGYRPSVSLRDGLVAVWKDFAGAGGPAQ
ncbi:MAG: NAD-dependent epimerase/dehydratase family protein [Pseudonocardiales bacterium]|nr:NAD-dependent epimerase/dehydratase family protein [Pseudonocardiales bacterium]MBV9030717.1 NAD-dependent epimerase/dehydratase family protein [Pseudonocardiales bacterium]MBW0011319.1 NAD-dependent epimerase/dehydratase family protein [Pseudonocardiales bacterium]